LIPNGERDRDGEAEELVGAEALGFVGVLIVGVLDTEADAFPGLGAGEGDFDVRFFLLEGEQVDIGAVEGFWRFRGAEFFDGSHKGIGERERIVRAEAEEGFELDEGEIFREAGGVEIVGDAALVDEREAFFREGSLAGGEALIGEGGGFFGLGEKLLERLDAGVGLQDLDGGGAHFGDEEAFVVADFAEGAEDIDSGGPAGQREAGGERECLGEADGEGAGALVAEDDIGEAGEFEFGVRPFARLGKAGSGFRDGEARGLEVAVVGEGGLDKGFETERGGLERDQGQERKQEQNFFHG